MFQPFSPGEPVVKTLRQKPVMIVGFAGGAEEVELGGEAEEADEIGVLEVGGIEDTDNEISAFEIGKIEDDGVGALEMEETGGI